MERLLFQITADKDPRGSRVFNDQKSMTNSNIYILRSTIHPELKKFIFLQFWAIFDVFSPWFLHFTHFWVDGRPGNEVIQILHILGDHLTPLTPLDLYPQCFTYLSFETDFWLFPLCELCTAPKQPLGFLSTLMVLLLFCTDIHNHILLGGVK